MCGIAGIYAAHGQLPVSGTVERMTQVLDHRGPDNSACIVRGPFALGHARLSIIDVAAVSHQPMFSADGRHVVVFNGEIYNFLELRKELESEGVRFRTSSDTEVLLEAFRRWDVACFPRLNGMFAAAFADLESGVLTLVRDRFGIKPLLYAEQGGNVFFASELKSLLSGLRSVPRVNALKLVEFLAYQELIEGTFFEGIRSLEPGTYVRLGGGGGAEIVEQPWFTVESLVEPELIRELRSLPYNERVNRVDESLRQSVRRHLISDVPVGTLCSGGTDSSLLTALCTQERSAVSVYHVDVEGMSERTWADRVARHLKVDMHYVSLNADSYLENYLDCIYFNDFPLTHPNGVGIFLVSDLARRNNCKVLLTGEGADETFGGYDWRYRKRLRFRSISNALRLPIRVTSYAGQLLTGIWPKKFDQKFGFKSRAPIAKLVSVCADQGFREDLFARCLNQVPVSMGPVEREITAALVSDLRDYISGILHRQDRASMQASIESRVPFLDHTLARIAVNLPLKDKVKFTDDKPLLKELAARYLPKEIVFREKVGFGMPSEAYARKIDESVLNGGFVEQTFGIAGAKLRELAQDDFRAFGQHLLGLEFWGRMFAMGESREKLRDRYVKVRSG